VQSKLRILSGEPCKIGFVRRCGGVAAKMVGLFAAKLTVGCLAGLGGCDLLGALGGMSFPVIFECMQDIYSTHPSTMYIFFVAVISW
jgi:hypothetical protein